MALVYNELNFSLQNQLLIVSWPQKGIQVFSELNKTRDDIDWSWPTGADTPETRHLADLMKSAGYWWLQDRKPPS